MRSIAVTTNPWGAPWGAGGDCLIVGRENKEGLRIQGFETSRRFLARLPRRETFKKESLQTSALYSTVRMLGSQSQSRDSQVPARRRRRRRSRSRWKWPFHYHRKRKTGGHVLRIQDEDRRRPWSLCNTKKRPFHSKETDFTHLVFPLSLSSKGMRHH